MVVHNAMAVLASEQYRRANADSADLVGDNCLGRAHHQTRALRVSRHVRDAQARQRQAQGGWQLAGERLDLNRDL